MIRFILLNLTFTFVLKWEASSWTTDFITVFAEFFCGSFFFIYIIIIIIIIIIYHYLYVLLLPRQLSCPLANWGGGS